MNSISEAIPYLQNFFQMNFLFSGLEVPSMVILAARLLTLIVLGCGILCAIFKIILKLLDCLQTLLSNLGQIPWLFYLLPLLLIPSSADTLASKWIGYALLIFALLALSLLGVLALVLWKYGVDQALRLINRISHPRSKPSVKGSSEPSMPPDNIVTSFAD